MKDFLKKLIAAKETEIEATRAAIRKSDSADEVRALGETLDKLLTELQEAKDQLANAEAESDEARDLKPIGTYKIEKREEEKLGTMEYRKAFMNYVQRGETSNLLVKRDDTSGTASDLGVLLPVTVVQEIIKGVEKVYGQLYSRVRKTNLKGGVKYPIGAFSATFTWIGENTKSDRQNAGDVDSYVEFTYHIGECRIAVSLLQSVLSVDVFEKELSKVIIEAYVKEMDKNILLGTGTNSPTGILTNSANGLQKIAASNIVKIKASEIDDWKVWQKKLFAKIPLSMRGLKPEFVMNAATFESNILTLEDSAGNPVAREAYNPVDGSEIAKFKGRDVVFVEDDMFKPFDDATANDYFGMYWVPEKAYGINTNLQFGVKRYFDEENNQWVTKGLVIVDGKILDPKYIYLLQKVAD